MTKDTKYLDDNNKDDDSILTEDMLKRFDESYERVKKRLADPNYKPSRTVLGVIHQLRVIRRTSQEMQEKPALFQEKPTRKSEA